MLGLIKHITVVDAACPLQSSALQRYASPHFGEYKTTPNNPDHELAISKVQKMYPV